MTLKEAEQEALQEEVEKEVGLKKIFRVQDYKVHMEAEGGNFSLNMISSNWSQKRKRSGKTGQMDSRRKTSKTCVEMLSKGSRWLSNENKSLRNSKGQ